MRRRLWATILELNLQAAIDAGALPNVTLGDFDTDAPANVNDSDLDEVTTALRPHPSGTVTDCSLLLALFASLRLRYELVRRMNGSAGPIPYKEVQRATSNISETCRNHRSLVKGDNAALIFKQNLSDLLLRRILLYLHRPLASRARFNPVYYFSRKVSLDAALAILSPVPNEEFSHLVSIGGGMFKTRIIQVSLAVASELLREVEENGVMTESIGFRKTLINASEEVLRQTAKRIQLGETNADVKVHMKQSMVICQARMNFVKGESPLQQLAQSAKESLEMSVSLIQARSLPCDEEALTDEQVNFRQEFNLGSEFDFEDVFGTMDVGLEEPFNTDLLQL